MAGQARQRLPVFLQSGFVHRPQAAVIRSQFIARAFVQLKSEQAAFISARRTGLVVRE